MRNTNIYSSNGLNGMNINNINVETTNIPTINAEIHRNECQPMGFPVATKSQPKPKSKCIESSSRPTKRPPSERRFKCDQCERMFFTRKDVKRHLVVHTGIRNFACPFCTQRFGRKDHLVRHAKKSHNRDTRSSSSVKISSVNQTSDKMPSNGLPTLIEAKNGVSSVPMVPVISQQLAHNHNKQAFNYSTNCQSGDHSALVLLSNSNNNNITSINNSHNEVNDNQCSNYANHPNPTSNHSNHVMIAGMHANESLCQYMTGVHTFDEMMASNAMKSETPSPLTAHHYFAFPVNSSSLTYPLPNPPFLPNCLVTNSNSGLSSCASSASVGAFGIPVSNVSNASNPIHTTFSVDVNPSLPHFNQAFQ